jgi:hypothetical protein
VVDRPADIPPVDAVATERTLLQDHVTYLQNLEIRIRQHAGQNTAGVIRADAIAVAIDHLESAIRALEMAGRE